MNISPKQKFPPINYKSEGFFSSSSKFIKAPITVNGSDLFMQKKIKERNRYFDLVFIEAWILFPASGKPVRDMLVFLTGNLTRFGKTKLNK